MLIVAERYNEDTMEWEEQIIEDSTLTPADFPIPLALVFADVVSIAKAAEDITKTAFCQINGLETEMEEN